MSAVVLASALALFRATLSSPDPLFGDAAARGPEPLGGIWAALPADCAPPTGQDLALWPKCATPIGFVAGEVAALRRPDPENPPPRGEVMAMARTKYRTVGPDAAGAPEIVEIDVPVLFNRSTIYLALLPDAVAADGTFVSATGWPVGCPPAPAPGISQDGPRCTAESAAAVRAAALSRPAPDKIYRLMRVPQTGEAPAGPVVPPDGTGGSVPGAGEAAPEGRRSAEAGTGVQVEDGQRTAGAEAEPAAPEPPATSSPSTPPTAPPGAIGEAPLTPPAPTPPPQPAAAPSM